MTDPMIVTDSMYGGRPLRRPASMAGGALSVVGLLLMLCASSCGDVEDDGRPSMGAGSNEQGGHGAASNTGGVSTGGVAPATGGATGTGSVRGGGGPPAAGGGGAGTGGQVAGGAPQGGSGSGGADEAGSGGAASGGSPNGTGGLGQLPAGSEASAQGRQLLLAGEPFRIRGVNWNPVPVGGTHPNDLDFAGFADTDIALMKAAGINSIRTYERIEDVEVLDKLHAAGIYVFSTVYGYWQDEPSVVIDRVQAVKEHPAILAWVLGNEWNYNQLYSDGQLTTEQARSQINQAAALIRATDDSHLIATIYGELGDLGTMVDAMPDIDLWGINSYRGLSHGDLFESYAALANRPMFLGEYGADAYNALLSAVDLASQAEATRALTLQLIDNYVTDSGGVTAGGFVFEFADEWWKDGTGSPAVQDVGGIAPGGGPHPDQTFNEEYWGLVDIERRPRPAYDELKALYAP